jgi:hypothetical protein
MGPRWPVWTGAENLVSTGIRSPDRPVRSESFIVKDNIRNVIGILAAVRLNRARI